MKSSCQLPDPPDSGSNERRQQVHADEQAKRNTESVDRPEFSMPQRLRVTPGLNRASAIPDCANRDAADAGLRI